MAKTRRGGAASAPAALSAGSANWNLLLATVAFAVNFWSWALLSPLAPVYGRELGLSSFQTAALTAVPVLVGSLGRIPVGALTDRFGGRLMFSIVSAVAIVPVLFLSTVEGYAALIAGGFALGIGGTSFAIGVPHVNAWFPPARRGFAIGVFGAGTGGTAISAFLTPRISENVSREAAFLVVAVALGVVAVLCLLTMRNSPAWTPSTQSMAEKFGAAARLTVTWELAVLYAVTFGGYVALSNYLPTYLRQIYELEITDASTRMAGFVILAVIARPVGGALSDRIGAIPVLVGSLGIVAFFAVVQAFEGPLVPWATVAFLSLAAGVGAGAGATFALVAKVTPASQVGAVTGIVGAAGGLGGFVPPLLMGAILGGTGSYAIGLMLLSDVALAALVFTVVKLARDAREREAPAGRPTTKLRR
jgi:NNP family nitrate/nitrite transporter-like MFS transporter